MKVIALIPCRKGSKRLPGKNMALLYGHPLLWYAIRGAKESGLFDEIVVSTDWSDAIEYAENMGVNVLLRPDELCTDMSHDYEWVRHTIGHYPDFDVFCILRPTSPFRTAETIRRAMESFLAPPRCDSMRAVEPTRAHPGKSWLLRDGLMRPYAESQIMGFPGHDMATQALLPVYCQNGCIHIARTETLEKYGNVSGESIKGYITVGREGIDINTPEDLQYAEWLMRGKG